MARSRIHVAVLAGGSGTRFWPAGRVSRPKQLLALDGDDPRPLLDLTLERVAPLSSRPVKIVAPRSLRGALQRVLGDGVAALYEPAPRNTAAAVALAAYAARAEGPDDPVLVVPADHHARPVGAYRNALRAMATRARRSDSIVTLGLTPSRPATGYGYLALGDEVDRAGGLVVRRVKRFVEKPDAERARRFVEAGNTLWNGGTFAFRPDVFIAELRRVLPDAAGPFDAAFGRYGKRGFAAALTDAYAKVPRVSVDFGVMERARAVETVVASFDWDDLGSWDAVARHRRTDDDGNAARGPVTLVDTEDCVVEAADGHVALLGVKDLIVVRTGDTVLIAKRGRGEDVRDVVARLEREGRGELLR